MFTIKNNQLVLEVSEKAAEVHRLSKLDEEYNYVWSGDPKYWAGRNPTLFPQVASNTEKTFKVDGVKYQTGNHGFARNSMFTLVDKKDDEVTLKLETSEETLKQYPFKFELLVNYKLVDNKVIVKYTVTNKDEKVMPYGFGQHPAFNVVEGYKDTYVVFDNAEESCGTRLDISKELFEQYPTYIINNPKSTKCTMYTGDRAIGLEYPGYKIFAIWSPFAPFVCLEPWMNKCPADPEIELKDRPGTMFLNPGESQIISYNWVVEK